MISKIATVIFTNCGGLGAKPPGEGGSGKAAGFEAWGKAFPLYDKSSKMEKYTVIVYNNSYGWCSKRHKAQKDGISCWQSM
ncbi:MAG: hypothetical protein LBD47_06615 [Treponema sp.]|jgi:hypothetical protein|nr:hypothetical protein [Treponema sp.]